MKMNIAAATQLIADYLAANLIGADVAQAANAAIRQQTVYGDELNDSNRGRLLSLAFGIRTSSPVSFAPAYTVLEG